MVVEQPLLPSATQRRRCATLFGDPIRSLFRTSVRFALANCCSSNSTSMERRGVAPHRPGPATRQAVQLAEADDRRCRWREKQQRFRARVRERQEREADRHEDADEDDGGRSHSTLGRRAVEFSRDLIWHLERLPDEEIRAAVMDIVFKNEAVRMLMPDYYPSPEDARAQRDILQNIRLDLQAMKVPHYGMLARKRAILEAVVSDMETDATQFPRILGTRKQNLVSAARRLSDVAEETSSRFKVPGRKKREGGIPEEVCEVVVSWWTDETRVSRTADKFRRNDLDSDRTTGM